MNKSDHFHQRREAAFTLIELIVVIAIIGLLAAMIIPIAGAANAKKRLALATTQLKALQSAIDDYKTKLGFYPPDNPNNFVTNQLYFELMGTTNNGAPQVPPTTWGTMDGSAWIYNSQNPNINTYFGVTGLANTSTRLHTDDQGAAASTFLKNLTANQIGVVDPAYPQVKILICSIPWPQDKTPPPIAGAPQETPFNYNSSHPTNNVGSYDLWVDIVLKGKTNRISNWNPNPIIL